MSEGVGAYRVVCTGGGTAGHVVPAIPVIERLVESGCRVSYVGSTSGLEAQLLKGVPVDYHGIAAGKLRRYFSFKTVGDAFRVLAGTWQAYWLLGRLRPDAVFSKGGFVSFPVVLAAWARRIPVVAHESDLTPGLANRLALPFVAALCVNFAETRLAGFSGRIVHTGTPLRPALLAGDAARGRQRLGLSGDKAGDKVGDNVGAKPILLVTGGSLGAEALNDVVRAALPRLIERFEVVHVCGPGKCIASRETAYHQFEYVDEGWGDLLAAAQVVVSRAGANTLYELLALNKLNVLVPLSRRVSRGDQVENAAYAEQAGLSVVVTEQALTPATLDAALDSLLAREAAYAARLARFVGPDATMLISQILLDMASKRRRR